MSSQDYNDALCDIRDALMDIRDALRGIRDHGVILNKPDGSGNPVPVEPEPPKAWNKYDLRDQHQATADKYKCPLCDGPMKARETRATGEWFCGCSNFPECTGTRSLDGTNTTRRKPPQKVSEPEDDDCPF